MAKSGKVGQPRKYKTINVNGIKIQSIFNKKTYKTEKELKDYIENNIDICIKDLENEEVLLYKREYNFSKIFNDKQKSRVDFYVKTKTNKGIIIECKNPTNIYPELVTSISQLLAYNINAQKKGFVINSLWIITTVYDNIIFEIIDKYNLPINICAINKNKIAIWKHII